MMKVVLFFFLAVIAIASAGVISVPTAYTAEAVHQVHSPWAVSSSSRVQTFNDAALLAPVAIPAPVAYAAPVAAPIAHYAAPYATYL